MHNVDALHMDTMPLKQPETEQRKFVIELESQGTDFHTVFKNQNISMTENKDLLVNSIVRCLDVRGFVLKEQIISYFSRKAKCFVAVAKRPIPSNAIIPGDDIDKDGRLTLKIWPVEYSLSDCQPAVQTKGPTQDLEPRTLQKQPSSLTSRSHVEDGANAVAGHR